MYKINSALKLDWTILVQQCSGRIVLWYVSQFTYFGKGLKSGLVECHSKFSVLACFTHSTKAIRHFGNFWTSELIIWSFTANQKWHKNFLTKFLRFHSMLFALLKQNLVRTFCPRKWRGNKISLSTQFGQDTHVHDECM